MKIRTLRLVDLWVSVFLIGAAVVASRITKLGNWEFFYFVPYIVWELGCSIYAITRRRI